MASSYARLIVHKLSCIGSEFGRPNAPANTRICTTKGDPIRKCGSAAVV